MFGKKWSMYLATASLSRSCCFRAELHCIFRPTVFIGAPRLTDYCESAAAAADENDRPARRAGKGVTWLRSSTNRSARVRHFLAWAPYTVAGRPDISRFNDRTWFWLKFGLRIAAITFSVKNASVLWLISFVVTHIWDFLPQSLHCNNFPGIS